MRKFYLNKNSTIEENILEVENIPNLQIPSVMFDNESSYKIMVKKGNYVKINDVILCKDDGQKILSPISGKIKDIKTDLDIFNKRVEYIEIENDFKNNIKLLEKPSINTKPDLINICKNFGLINNKFYLYKYFENLKVNSTFYFNAIINDFKYLNKSFLEENLIKIEEVLQVLNKIFKFKKIVVYKLKNDNIKLNGFNLKLSKKPLKNALNISDFIDIYNAIKGIAKSYSFITVYGGAVYKNMLVKVKLGTNLNEVLNLAGGFKQNIEEIENYKYTAMLAYNDELELKNKIKKTTNKDDKIKLKNLLLEKQKEAQDNVFSRFKEFQEKFYNCLSAISINNIKDKLFITDYNKPINNSVFSVSFLSFKDFH